MTLNISLVFYPFIECISYLPFLVFPFTLFSSGVMVFIVPAILLELLPTMKNLWALHTSVGMLKNGYMLRYIVLALINGFAFASYK